VGSIRIPRWLHRTLEIRIRVPMEGIGVAFPPGCKKWSRRYVVVGGGNLKGH